MPRMQSCPDLPGFSANRVPELRAVLGGWSGRRQSEAKAGLMVSV